MKANVDFSSGNLVVLKDGKIKKVKSATTVAAEKNAGLLIEFHNETGRRGLSGVNRSFLLLLFMLKILLTDTERLLDHQSWLLFRKTTDHSFKKADESFLNLLQLTGIFPSNHKGRSRLGIGRGRVVLDRG